MRSGQGLLAHSIYMEVPLALFAQGNSRDIRAGKGNNASCGVAEMDREHVKLL